MLSGQPYSQHLASLCLLSVAYFAMRVVQHPRPIVVLLTGASFGLGCITRPSMVSIAAVLLVGMLLVLRSLPERRAKWGLGLAALGSAVVAAAFVAPVVAHNIVHGAGSVISTNNERNFFLGNNPYTHDYKTSHLGQRSLSDLPPEVRSYLGRFKQEPDPRRAMQKEALRYIGAHPWRTLYRSANRALAFWGFDYLSSRIVQNHLGLHTPAFLVLLAAEAGGYLLIMLLAIAAAFGMRQALDRGWLGWSLALVVAYQLPYVLAFSGGTYHFPVVWLIIPLAAVSLQQLRDEGFGVFLGRGGIFRRRDVALASVVFLLVQFQYAHYALAMSGSP
jgi:4-amino-4-deoxy-L-arabinose transferase-like glycosyltransferase